VRRRAFSGMREGAYGVPVCSRLTTGLQLDLELDMPRSISQLGHSTPHAAMRRCSSSPHPK